MPFKHQSDSYRHRKGVRYLCHEDVCEEPVVERAKQCVAAIRAQGIRAFYESHPDGYARVFVEDSEPAYAAHLLIRPTPDPWSSQS